MLRYSGNDGTAPAVKLVQEDANTPLMLVTSPTVHTNNACSMTSSLLTNLQSIKVNPNQYAVHILLIGCYFTSLTSMLIHY